jgi:hypothetical protein
MGMRLKRAAIALGLLVAVLGSAATVGATIQGEPADGADAVLLDQMERCMRGHGVAVVKAEGGLRFTREATEERTGRAMLDDCVSKARAVAVARFGKPVPGAASG